MPNITTHHFFAQDVFLASSSKITQTFQNEQKLYTLFAQGFDPFFFDFSILREKSFANFCHTNETDTFFLNFIENMKKKNVIKNEKVLAALYGHLTHYVLDSNCHPFIIYKSGVYNKSKPETSKYNGKHTSIEMQIDAYLYEKRFAKPFSKFKIHKELIPKEKFGTTLIDILNCTYEDTFHVKKKGKKYQRDCRFMYDTYKYLIMDKTGIKKKIYKGIDVLTPKKYGVFATFNSHITNIDLSILNLDHKTWLNPWNGEKRNDSFLDLYQEALQEAVTLLEVTLKYLNNEITKEKYQKILKDKSYTTGFSWHEKKELKYLEF